MAPVLNSHFLASILERFRQAASTLRDPRKGSNKRYSLPDAAACALSTFFFQCPSFLNFQFRMRKQSARSTCRALFGVERIPCDNHIRNLLEGPDPSFLSDLFPLCLDTVRDYGALDSFRCLDDRLLVALDGIQFHCSDSIHCEQCSTRHVGKHKKPQYFHTMLAAAVVADGHSRVLPLMPEFVQPRNDPAASQPDLPEKQRKQDCERNAAKRWLRSHLPALLPYRPLIMGDDLYCCHPICQLVRDLGADILATCKPSSHKTLYDQLPNRRIWSTGWFRARNRKRQVEEWRIRWRNNVPLRAGKDALRGNWLQLETRRQGKRTYRNEFFTTLKITADNVAAIARAGRARWNIEEAFNCLARRGYGFKHNFGHGQHGLANVLATMLLLAFTLHSVLDCLNDLWRQCRGEAGTRRNFFNKLRDQATDFLCPDWTALLENMLGLRQLAAMPP